MDIILLGYGRMGKEIEDCARSRGHRISAQFSSANPASGETMKGDVAIDFSVASTLFYHLSLALDNHIPLVIGTTGWNDQLAAVRAVVEQVKGSVVYGSNFSIGMQMFMQIVQRAAALLNNADAYDVSMHEIHHKRKLDAPSGTALSLADIILAEVDRKTHVLGETSHGRIDDAALHLSSSRVGEVAGTHTVLIDSAADSIELRHTAKNRSGFALGAVRAAEWIVDHPGLHDFSAVFEQMLREQQS